MANQDLMGGHVSMMFLSILPVIGQIQAGTLNLMLPNSYSYETLEAGYGMRSLYVHSVRSAYGLGRSPWAKVLPIGLLGFASIASLILVVINTQLPTQVIAPEWTIPLPIVDLRTGATVAVEGLLRAAGDHGPSQLVHTERPPPA